MEAEVTALSLIIVVASLGLFLAIYFQSTRGDRR